MSYTMKHITVAILSGGIILKSVELIHKYFKGHNQPLEIDSSIDLLKIMKQISPAEIEILMELSYAQNTESILGFNPRKIVDYTVPSSWSIFKLELIYKNRKYHGTGWLSGNRKSIITAGHNVYDHKYKDRVIQIRAFSGVHMRIDGPYYVKHHCLEGSTVKYPKLFEIDSNYDIARINLTEEINLKSYESKSWDGSDQNYYVVGYPGDMEDGYTMARANCTITNSNKPHVISHNADTFKGQSGGLIGNGDTGCAVHVRGYDLSHNEGTKIELLSQNMTLENFII